MRRPERCQNTTVELKQQDKYYTSHILKLQKIKQMTPKGDATINQFPPCATHFDNTNNLKANQRMFANDRSNYLLSLLYDQNLPSERTRSPNFMTPTGDRNCSKNYIDDDNLSEMSKSFFLTQQHTKNTSVPTKHSPRSQLSDRNEDKPKIARPEQKSALSKIRKNDDNKFTNSPSTHHIRPITPLVNKNKSSNTKNTKNNKQKQGATNVNETDNDLPSIEADKINSKKKVSSVRDVETKSPKALLKAKPLQSGKTNANYTDMIPNGKPNQKENQSHNLQTELNTKIDQILNPDQYLNSPNTINNPAQDASILRPLISQNQMNNESEGISPRQNKFKKKSIISKRC